MTRVERAIRVGCCWLKAKVGAIKAPTTAAAATYRFNGDTVVATTGERIHPEGYYQDATVGAGAGAADFLAVIGVKAERVAGIDGFDAAAGSAATGVGAAGFASSGAVSSMGTAVASGS